MARSRILTPDQRLRVFVSSTLHELSEERAAARTAVRALRLSPVLFEIGARPHPPQELYRAYLGQSDIFVGIYWQSYGWIAPGMELSGLEDEFHQSEGMPRLIYVKTPAPEREARLAAFLTDILEKADVSYKQFSTATELSKLVKDDLALLLTEGFARATSARREASECQAPSGAATADSTAPTTTIVGEEVAGTAPQRLDTFAPSLSGSEELQGPSIAVLPFSNLSGDPDHGYFVDGTVDGIISALSRFKWLTVIARNSTFVYKDRAEDIRRIAKDLGARYVLEGSVRAAGQRVRIHGQLIDASTGAHLWADHFDGNMEDVFDLEDQITENVVGALEPQIRRAEIERTRRKRPESLDAYDLFLRALPHAYAMSPEDNAAALGFLEEAMRLDPGYAPAKAFAAWCYEERLTRGWPDANPEDTTRAVRLAQEVLAADTDDANIIALAGFVYVMVGRRYDSGLQALHHAVELNPNNAFVLMLAGWADAWAGDVNVALQSFERARLLNPRDPAAFYVITGLAWVNLLLGRLEEAAELAARSAAIYERWDATYFVLGMALAGSSRTDEARAAISKLLELWPRASISHYRRVLPIRDADRLTNLEHYMRLAGLPEGD